MNDNVERLSTVTKADLPSELVLQAAIDGEVESAVVIGWGSEGSLYFASAVSDIREVSWLLRRASLQVDRMAEEMEA